MKTELLFQLDLKWDNTTYKPLKELVIREFYDYDLKRYIWVFKVKDLKKVLAIIGKEIEINKEELIPLIKRCPYIIEKFEIGKYKGTGLLEVTEFPNLFMIDTIINKKKVTKRIPKETVDKLWKVVRKQPLNKPIKTNTVAENYCNEMGITRFNRESGSYDFAKFFGNRQDYFQFYYSLKVLEHYCVIEHHKYGAVERLKNNWEIEKKLSEPLVKG